MLIAHCQKAEFDGDSLMEDQDVRYVIADMLIDMDVQRLMGLRNFWHRYVRDPHPYGGPQFLYFQRMVRLRNSERVQQILGFDALAPDASVHEEADFDRTMAELRAGEDVDAATLERRSAAAWRGSRARWRRGRPGRRLHRPP